MSRKVCVRTVTDVVDAVEVLVAQLVVHVLTRRADYLQRVAGEEQRTVLTENNTEHTEGRQTNALNTSHIYHCMEGRMEMFYLTMHSTHFIYSYMASDIC